MVSAVGSRRRSRWGPAGRPLRWPPEPGRSCSWTLLQLSEAAVDLQLRAWFGSLRVPKLIRLLQAHLSEVALVGDVALRSCPSLVDGGVATKHSPSFVDGGVATKT